MQGGMTVSGVLLSNGGRKGKQPGGAYIPLSFSPGDAYQFDWSHEQVILGGVAQKVKVAHFRLCHKGC